MKEGPILDKKTNNIDKTIEICNREDEEMMMKMKKQKKQKKNRGAPRKKRKQRWKRSCSKKTRKTQQHRRKYIVHVENTKTITLHYTKRSHYETHLCPTFEKWSNT